MAVWRRLSAAWVAVLAGLVLSACGGQEQALRIGFVASFSGGGQDLVIGARNGVQQAIDAFNAAGGHHGRVVELVLADLAVDSPAAAIARFQQQGVEFVIGPLLSVEALGLLRTPGAEALVFVSPTVTTPALSGRDDNFFRVVPTVQAYAASMAERLYARGLRTAAMVRETTNPEYSLAWQDSFSERFIALGGCVVMNATLSPSDAEGYQLAAKQVMAATAEVAVVVGPPLDVARFAQRLRDLPGRQPVLASAEWGGGESLPELGGHAVEGVIVQQFFDRDANAPRYLEFAAAYAEHYRQPPGFVTVLAYDAANAVLQAIRQRRAGQSARDAMRALQTLEGLQQTLHFDRYGDTLRSAHMVRVEAGRFVAEGDR
ncbi:ABC transporter substrate-binding protein [Pseudothauera hydrothermalis]|uniref:ABC transporter substrate-binding protein n=1 Tax=Pseudothauera hydrothermalis TaxID=2184083 RepID=UPI000E09A94A|nr:ABC transporter substrate-binding protein [Pseudothauera hydrothermalis]